MHSTPFSDPTMAALHQQVREHFGELPTLRPIPPEEYFWQLCESIIGQQLSEKVAPQIVSRVRNVLNEKLVPESVLATTDHELRGAGLSFSKASYLKNVAAFWLDPVHTTEDFTQTGDEELITHLVQIKGVGRWTAEMFLIFTMQRADIFSAGDYGLRKAALRAYHLPDTTTPRELSTLAERWSPHRSLACRVLWKSLELPRI